VIDVTDLTVRLGGTTVLDDLTTRVDQGRFVGLIGPNGAGKTTLLRTVAATLTPDSGSVHVGGEDVHRLSSRASSRLVAVVPQETQLAFDFDVRDVVEMGRTPYRTRLRNPTQSTRSAVERAMERTEVTELAARSIRSVSGGERQRVLLARALAQDTPVLALDEPTANLDINHQARTLELVRDLVDEGKTILAAIHDLNLAARYCDELQLLSQAEIVASGPPDAVLTSANLEDAFETNAVVARHPVTGSVHVSALPDAPQRTSTGSVHVIGGGGTASRLLSVLSAAGFDVSVGALAEGDADLETARALGLDVVTTPPHSSIDAETALTVRERVRATDVTVLADIEVGHGNLPNLEAARESNSLVVVEERPFEDRNYAGREARALYTSLRTSGSVVEPDDVLDTVIESVPGDRAPV
jgi:iron complex transport system ATP-binding protein